MTKPKKVAGAPPKVSALAFLVELEYYSSMEHLRPELF